MRGRRGGGRRGASLGCLIAVFSVALASRAVGARARSSEGTCQNKRHYLPYARAGSAPGKGKGLTFCDAHRASTCCGREQTDSVRARVVHMTLNGFSETCRDAWAAVECSVCDGRVGASEGMPVCVSACDALYQSCRNDYFAEDSAQRLVPCRPGDVICTKLSEWIGDARDKGSEMCAAAGWDPVRAGERWCFDGASAFADASRSSDAARRSHRGKSDAKSSKTSKKSKSKSSRASKSSKQDARRLAVLAGGGAGLAYVLFSRGAPALLKLWHRKNSVNARYAARAAAERRSRAHYL